VINQGGEDQECQNEKVFDSYCENNQGMRVSNIACQEEKSERIEMARSTEKSKDIEKNRKYSSFYSRRKPFTG